jgi:hypothetical protein
MVVNTYHEPVVETVVQARSPKTGKPSVIVHVCRECGRRVADGNPPKHLEVAL